jgi:hypothetical protein
VAITELSLVATGVDGSFLRSTGSLSLFLARLVRADAPIWGKSSSGCTDPGAKASGV